MVRAAARIVVDKIAELKFNIIMPFCADGNQVVLYLPKRVDGLLVPYSDKAGIDVPSEPDQKNKPNYYAGRNGPPSRNPSVGIHESEMLAQNTNNAEPNHWQGIVDGFKDDASSRPLEKALSVFVA